MRIPAMYSSCSMILSFLCALLIPSQVLGFSNTTQASGLPPCDALSQAGLGNRLLYPTSEAYESQIQTWWALNTRQRPWCLILPKSTDEVSRTLIALSSAGSGAGDWHIAIRSGGHASEGSNNIANGVTIDLSHLNSTVYDARSHLASVQPGARWRDVYAQLLESGVSVTGGRDGGVGVGGFLLGGGNSYYTGRNGFGCDTVANFEVVLGNGSIVNANRDENADLWKALKGGSSNFGIVTRFDLEAFPAQNLSLGTRVMSSEYAEDFVNAIVEFVDASETRPDDHLIPFFYHTPNINGTIMLSIQANTQGDLNTTAFRKVDQIPAISPGSMISTSLADAAAGSEVQGDSQVISFTLTFQNNPQIIQHTTSLHEALVADLSTTLGASNFTSFCFFQPLPRYIADLSNSHGGNMLGFDRAQSHNILWVLTVLINGSDADKVWVHTKVADLTAEIETFAKSVGGHNELVYLNYADASQDPLGSYGEENVRFIREVAARYDPEGFFQTRVPGGFKVSRVL